MLRFRSGFIYGYVCVRVNVKKCACMRACNSGPLVYSDKLFGVLRQRLSNIHNSLITLYRFTDIFGESYQPILLDN